MFDLMKAKGPEEAIKIMAKSNPMVANAMKYAESHDSYKDAFYAMAAEKGADPNQVIQMVKNMGIR